MAAGLVASGVGLSVNGSPAKNVGRWADWSDGEYVGEEGEGGPQVVLGVADRA